MERGLGSLAPFLFMKLDVNYPYPYPVGISWDKRFLELAQHIAQWSKDPSTKVGAVIVDKERRVVSLGYNGFPRCVNDTYERLNNKSVKLQLVKHAEENAIFNAIQRPTNCTIYVTHHPCASCAGSIVQSGITRVAFPSSCMDNGFGERWAESLSLAQQIFSEAKVVCEAI